jgi:hypothetical protein
MVTFGDCSMTPGSVAWYPFVWRHFADANAFLGGAHEVLTVAQNCNDRNAQ